MFFDRPNLATRYPNQLIGELRDLIFNENNIEEIYYTAAYSVYRLILHFNSKRLLTKYRKYKWYLLMLIKYIASNGGTANVQHKDISKTCESILRIMSKNDGDSVEKIKKCCELFDSFSDVTDDKMKRQAFVEEVKEKFFKKGV
jgi:hypothetical protein